VADDRARLHAAEELLDEGTIRVLDRFGVSSGWRCLEVGAGGGSIASWLAARDAEVVATDVDTRFLQASGIEARTHDVVRDSLETDAYDLVHARLVLEHLPERDIVLDKLVSALRPGGWLVIEDVDYVSAIPVSDLGAREHAHTQQVRLDAFGRTGIDPYYGRRLPERLRKAGLHDVGNEARAWVMEGGSPGARWFQLSLAHLRPRLVGSNLLTDAEVDRMLELFGDPNWAALSPLIVAAWGQRPPRG
jgi:SAM-dependent methyltransferase